MSYQAAIRDLAAAELTPQMTANAVRLLARADADGMVMLAMDDLQALFGVESRNAARKYLGRLRMAGLLDYSLGRSSVRVWWLAWGGSLRQAPFDKLRERDGEASTGSASAGSADGRARPGAAQRGPGAGRKGAGNGTAAGGDWRSAWSPWERK